jgi:hypothetical protein
MLALFGHAGAAGLLISQSSAIFASQDGHQNEIAPEHPGAISVTCCGRPRGTRTPNPLIKSQLLYQLS